MTTGTLPYQIILVEDNLADVSLVQEALREHQVDCVLRVIGDGAEAITYLERLDADPHAAALHLLLLDMHLPKRDGEEILKRLRSTERYAQTPVVVMTGADSVEIHGKATKHAALFYFPKPSRLDEYLRLGAVVLGVLDGARVERSRPDAGAGAPR